jgi:hypothetical protein
VVRALGYPRAALLAFGLAVVAFNVLAIIETAIATERNLNGTEIEVSTYYAADDVRSDYRGMLITLAVSAWDALDDQSAIALARTLRTHPRRSRPKVREGYARGATVPRHVASARVLRNRAIP